MRVDSSSCPYALQARTHSRFRLRPSTQSITSDVRLGTDRWCSSSSRRRSGRTRSSSTTPPRAQPPNAASAPSTPYKREMRNLIHRQRRTSAGTSLRPPRNKGKRPKPGRANTQQRATSSSCSSPEKRASIRGKMTDAAARDKPPCPLAPLRHGHYFPAHGRKLGPSAAQKVAELESVFTKVMRLNTLVEQYAVATAANKEQTTSSLKRAADQLKLRLMGATRSDVADLRHDCIDCRSSGQSRCEDARAARNDRPIAFSTRFRFE